jgi:thioredoxin 1
MSITTEKDLLSIQKENSIYVFIFSSTFCGPCKTLKEYVEKISDDYKEAKFIYIDLKDYPKLFDNMKITSVPKTYIYINKANKPVIIDGGNLNTFTKTLNIEYEKYLLMMESKQERVYSENKQ